MCDNNHDTFLGEGYCRANNFRCTFLNAKRGWPRMKIRKIAIHNYRSIKDITLAVSDTLVLLGANNHGKSNILSALEFGLSPSFKPKIDDFCAFRSSNDPTLWIEITFADLTDSERTTFLKYFRGDHTVCIRKTATMRDDNQIDISYNGYVQEPENWWLKESAFQRLSSREQTEEEAKSVPPLKALLEESGKITKQRLKDFQEAFIEKHLSEITFSETLESGPLLGTKNVAAGVLPEFYLVPAVRDLSEEAKVKGSTTFGKLLQRAVKDMAERDRRFVGIREQLQKIVGELNQRPESGEKPLSELGQLESILASELEFWGVKVFIEVTPPEIEKLFELGTELHLDDGLKTLAEKKGHGLQRAVLFALLRTWANVLSGTKSSSETKARQASSSAYFAIEEPELFLHPHAQRQLFVSLREIAKASDHQVFMCTHSTFFIDLEHYHEIAVITKPNAEAGTQVRQTTHDLFEGQNATERKRRFHMAYWINPDRSELFFAKKVILTEGETEKIVLPFLARRMGRFDPNVSIIECGSKYNLSLYIAIMNAFQIPYCVIHDEDPLPDPIPDEWSNEKRAEKGRLYDENGNIAKLVNPTLGQQEVLCPDFEGVSGISGNQSDKKGKAIAALDHCAQLPDEELPERLRTLIENAYRVS